jgi:hypothetical protein
MVLGKVDMHIKNNDIGPVFYIIIKAQKYTEFLNLKLETL